MHVAQLAVAKLEATLAFDYRERDVWLDRSNGDVIKRGVREGEMVVDHDKVFSISGLAVCELDVDWKREATAP
jgi:hypothetical protein